MNREEIEKKLNSMPVVNQKHGSDLYRAILREIACQLADMNEKQAESIKLMKQAVVKMPMPKPKQRAEVLSLWHRIVAEWETALIGMEAQVKESLPNTIASLNYKIEPDHSGDKSLFIRVVFRDARVKEADLLGAAHAVERCVDEWLSPVNYENLNLYFNYKSSTKT